MFVCSLFYICSFVCWLCTLAALASVGLNLQVCKWFDKQNNDDDDDVRRDCSGSDAVVSLHSCVKLLHHDRGLMKQAAAGRCNTSLKRSYRIGRCSQMFTSLFMKENPLVSRRFTVTQLPRADEHRWSSINTHTDTHHIFSDSEVNSSFSYLVLSRYETQQKFKSRD